MNDKMKKMLGFKTCAVVPQTVVTVVYEGPLDPKTIYVAPPEKKQGKLARIAAKITGRK